MSIASATYRKLQDDLWFFVGGTPVPTETPRVLVELLAMLEVASVDAEEAEIASLTERYASYGKRYARPNVSVPYSIIGGPLEAPQRPPDALPDDEALQAEIDYLHTVVGNLRTENAALSLELEAKK